MSYQPGGDVVAIDHEALDRLANTAAIQDHTKGHWLGISRCPRCVARARIPVRLASSALRPRELNRQTHPDTCPHADV
jgi:hypothetical protein